MFIPASHYADWVYVDVMLQNTALPRPNAYCQEQVMHESHCGLCTISGLLLSRSCTVKQPALLASNDL